ncbi:MAG: O-antigen ligase family protein [Patescibacteria group bacterium]
MESIKKYITSLNLVFFVEVLVVILTISGILPREALLFLFGILLFFVLFSSYEESILLIVRSIPLFTALPITETFDSLNTWRIIVFLLFLKWFFNDNFFLFFDAIFTILKKTKSSFIDALKFSYQKWKIESLIFLLFLISLFSLFKADDLIIGVKRIIYFINLGMLFFVIRSVAKNIELLKIAKNIVISGIIVVAIGFFQLYLAYVMPINDFSELWALKVNEALYGTAWSEIVISKNTWFAYYNDTIHLRMFSSFPDTHSFPLYLLMISAFSMVILFKRKGEKKSYTYIFLFILLTFFAIILSGTRGIWASFIFPIIFLIFIIWKKYFPINIVKIILIPFMAFLILLPLSSPIFSSKQFNILSQENKSSRAFTERFKSIIDIEEKSNKGRIYIWMESIKSIYKNPILGVGIGNYPVVLKEDASAIKAGSSAHNIYLHMAAELGIFGFLVFIFIIYEILKRSLYIVKENFDEISKFFSAITFLFLIWILGYLMTDVAIFDERAFLMLMILLGVLFSITSQRETSPLERKKIRTDI